MNLLNVCITKTKASPAAWIGSELYTNLELKTDLLNTRCKALCTPRIYQAWNGHKVRDEIDDWA